MPRFDTVARAVRENDFAAKTGRRAGVESKGSFLRKGIVGDWRSKFDERCLERFATAKDGRWRRLAEAVARRRGAAMPGCIPRPPNGRRPEGPRRSAPVVDAQGRHGDQDGEHDIAEGPLHPAFPIIEGAIRRPRS